MRVLFCTDGSIISYHAVQNFNKWVENATVDILCAIDWSFLPDTVAVEDSDFAVYCTNSADSILNYSEKFLLELGINIEDKIKMCGSTVDCILETLEKKEYDFVVLGSHGKKGIQKWLGSVSQEIASVANVSTYISKEKNSRDKIVFAVDSTDLSMHFVKKSIRLLNLENKDITLLTVYDTPDYLFLEGTIDSNWMLEIDKKQELAATLLLNDFETLFSDVGYNISNKIVLSGNPSLELIKYLDKNNIDLIVCGMRDRKNLSKFLLNSVSKRVLESTRSDVLIIRQ